MTGARSASCGVFQPRRGGTPRMIQTFAQYWDAPGSTVAYVKMAAAALTGSRPSMGASGTLWWLNEAPATRRSAAKSICSEVQSNAAAREPPGGRNREFPLRVRGRGSRALRKPARWAGQGMHQHCLIESCVHSSNSPAATGVSYSRRIKRPHPRHSERPPGISTWVGTPSQSSAGTALAYRFAVNTMSLPC
jgi:hypothetical protein